MHKTPQTLLITLLAVASVALAVPTHAGFVREIVFPVNGPHHFSDDFGDTRSGGREHLANDIIAAKMTPVVAAKDGAIRYIVIPEASWGYAIYLEDDEGWQYRYLHLNNDMPGTDDHNGGPENAYAPGIARGTHVFAGQLLGWVGDSGNAETTGSHLHFEMWTPDHAAINPYESLLAATPPSLVGPSGEIVKTKLIVPIGGTLIKYASDPKIYLLANSTKYHIANEFTFNALKFNWLGIKTIPATEQYRSGIPLNFIQESIALYEDGTLINTENAPASLTSYTFTRDLALGSTGTEVSELQRALKALGFFTYPTITGYFGALTRDAVITFQRANGIFPVGIVGPQTRALLNAL
ncbi:MAG: peptidoglycan-binding protein [Patescibacteria group bacterium]